VELNIRCTNAGAFVEKGVNAPDQFVWMGFVFPIELNSYLGGHFGVCVSSVYCTNAAVGGRLGAGPNIFETYEVGSSWRRSEYLRNLRGWIELA
jgi:hypothetical protein